MKFLAMAIFSASVLAVASAGPAKARGHHRIISCNHLGCFDHRPAWQPRRAYRKAARKHRRHARPRAHYHRHAHYRQISSKSARYQRKSAHIRRATASRPGLIEIRSAGGHFAKVASAFAGRFQAFVRDLESGGFRIRFMGGWRSWGSCRGCDAHPRGRALDIDQTARNVTVQRLPANVTQIAARHGLCHGAVWNNPDAGHFEVASGSRSVRCRQIAEAKSWPERMGEVKAASAGVSPF